MHWIRDRKGLMYKVKATGNKKKSAAEAAYSFLSVRMRTCHETEEHLRSKGYSEDEILETVNDLIGMKYIDDYQYALRYYEYNREKHRGSARAAAELLKRGVDADTVKFAREDFLHENHVSEYEDALDAAERELDLRDPRTGEEYRAVIDDRTAAKIARKLDSKGFERGDIFRVLEELRRR